MDEAGRRVRRVRDEHHLEVLVQHLAHLVGGRPGEEADAPHPGVRPWHQHHLPEHLVLAVREEGFPERLGRAVDDTDARNTGQQSVPRPAERARSQPRGHPSDDHQQHQRGEQAEPGDAVIIEGREPQVASEQVVDPVEEPEEHPQGDRGGPQHEEPGEEVVAEPLDDARSARNRAGRRGHTRTLSRVSGPGQTRSPPPAFALPLL